MSIKEFSRYKYQIDNQLKESDITFYNLVYGRFLDKIKTAKNYYGAILKKPFNYKKDEIENEIKKEIDLFYFNAPGAICASKKLVRDLSVKIDETTINFTIEALAS